MILTVLGILFVTWYVLNRKRPNRELANELIPTKREINQSLKHMENTSFDDGDILIPKIEDCLMNICSFLLSTNSSSLSRNEMYALLMNKVDTEEFKHIEDFFQTVDSYRFGKDSLQITPNELKIQFNIKMTKLLSKLS